METPCSYRLTMEPDSQKLFRGLRHIVRIAFGEDIGLAFAEAVSNAFEHAGGACLVTIAPRWIAVDDDGPGIGDGVTSKPKGEGGRGMGLIRNTGGRIITGPCGSTVVLSSGWIT